jgi:hypothetical protein
MLSKKIKKNTEIGINRPKSRKVGKAPKTGPHGLFGRFERFPGLQVQNRLKNLPF